MSKKISSDWKVNLNKTDWLNDAVHRIETICSWSNCYWGHYSTPWLGPAAAWWTIKIYLAGSWPIARLTASGHHPFSEARATRDLALLASALGPWQIHRDCRRLWPLPFDRFLLRHYATWGLKYQPFPWVLVLLLNQRKKPIQGIKYKEADIFMLNYGKVTWQEISPGDGLAITLSKRTFPFWTAITEVVGGSFLAQYFASEAEPLNNRCCQFCTTRRRRRKRRVEHLPKWVVLVCSNYNFEGITVLGFLHQDLPNWVPPWHPAH